jgi:1-acylglycerone phosphate reductase
MPALDISIAEATATFQTNVISVMHIVQVFSPLLIDSKGTIVQIGSVTAVMPYMFGSVYNATKAALLAYSNTLRIELEPFGVKVVTISTGGVRSRIARGHGGLPPGSRYAPVDDVYARRVTHSQDGAMETQVYAKRVVGRVLGLDSWVTWLLLRSKRKIWEGNMARVIWFVSTFLWDGALDVAMKRMFNIARLSARKIDQS